MRTKITKALALGFACSALLLSRTSVLAQSKDSPPLPVPVLPTPGEPAKKLPDPQTVGNAPAPPSAVLPTVSLKPVEIAPSSAPAVPKPVAPANNPQPSQVFPDGGFPLSVAAEASRSSALNAQQPTNASQPPRAGAEVAPPGFEARGPKDAPAVPEYSPLSSILPDYYYTPEYYLRPVVGPQGGADYAPPGYEAREYQDAPGVPEYTQILPPVPVTPEERQKFVTRGVFPGSYLVPGTNTSFRLRGFVRLTGIYDFSPVGTPDIFVVNSIPVPQTVGQNFNETARPTRFALESWTPTSYRDWTVHTFIEGDFFNGPGQAAGGGGNPFRLRHAFVDYGYFRVGQQNTVFMDGNTWPSLVDFQGPAGWVNQRRPGARVTLPICDQLTWAGGVEQPFSDITTNGLGTAVQDVPDFATNLRYETSVGHVQVSGLARAIGYRPTGGELTRRSAYGMSAGTTFHPWAWMMGTNPLSKANPTGLERCRIIGQYTFGWGIGRYMLDTVGLGLDGQVDANTGSFSLPYASGFVTSYEHWFTEKWMAQATWSETLVGTADGQPGSTYIGGKYVAGSLWYIPIRNLSLGSELLWGERENVDGDRGRARRLNALVQYNF